MMVGNADVNVFEDIEEVVESGEVREEARMTGSGAGGTNGVGGG